MRNVKVVVAGSRSFSDYEFLSLVLNKFLILKEELKFEEIEIVSGGARGADSLGERYATENGCRLTVMKADWDSYGRSAGYIRNAEMANYGDIIICFWDLKSRGTRQMIKTAKKQGKIVKVIPF